MPGSGVTKRMLADAMKQFLSERPLTKISVGDIVDACALNRNSFYYHFKDKYDLVNWIFYTEIVEELQKKSELTGWERICQICDFFYENKAFYANAFEITGQNSFTTYFHEVMKSAVMSDVESLFPDDEDRAFFATFFIDAFLSTIHRWLVSGAKTPPDRLAILIRRAAMGPMWRAEEVENALSGKPPIDWEKDA